MTKNRRATLSAPLEPRVRRAYFDCRYGQLHVHYALPAGGGFDEATTLLCIAGAPGSGRFFGPLLLPLGRDRSVYAPDLPGCGESDGAPGSYAPVELAEALGDFLDSMHLSHFDVLAHDSGVAIAAALLQQRHAQIGRVVLSPDTEAVRAVGRGLRQRLLVIDLRSADQRYETDAQTEHEAARLRDFLELA
jgi:pimeloyl-ACP methyl ester carboxylesterase